MKREKTLIEWIIVIGGGILLFLVSFHYLSLKKLNPKGALWTLTKWHQKNNPIKKSTPTMKVNAPKYQGKLVVIEFKDEANPPKEIEASHQQELEFSNQSKGTITIKDQKNYLGEMTLKAGESQVVDFNEPLTLPYTVHFANGRSFTGTIHIK